MGLLIVPPQTRWQVLLSTAFDGAPDAAGAVRRGGLRLLQCGRYARARRCEDRTPRHAVAYAAVYKAGAALRSAMRPALRGPHAAARCSVRRRLQAGAALRSAARPTLQAPCDVAVSASCDAGATLAPGAARTARCERRTLQRASPCDAGTALDSERPELQARTPRRTSTSAAQALHPTVRARRCQHRTPPHAAASVAICGASATFDSASPALREPQARWTRTPSASTSAYVGMPLQSLTSAATAMPPRAYGLPQCYACQSVGELPRSMATAMATAPPRAHNYSGRAATAAGPPPSAAPAPTAKMTRRSLRCLNR